MMKKYAVNYKNIPIYVFNKYVTKSNSKQIRGYLQSFDNAKYSELCECYKSYSCRKALVYNYIKKELKLINDGKIKNCTNARKLLITSYNSNFFTCAYLLDYIDEYTGEVYVILRYHTPFTVYNIFVENKGSEF